MLLDRRASVPSLLLGAVLLAVGPPAAWADTLLAPYEPAAVHLPSEASLCGNLPTCIVSAEALDTWAGGGVMTDFGIAGLDLSGVEGDGLPAGGSAPAVTVAPQDTASASYFDVLVAALEAANRNGGTGSV